VLYLGINRNLTAALTSIEYHGGDHAVLRGGGGGVGFDGIAEFVGIGT
jgi:hypothetical protein